MPHVRYVGKRGSFVQFIGLAWEEALGPEYTVPLHGGQPLALPGNAHVVPLDDFGPDASLNVLSSFSTEKARRGHHRRFVETVVPLGRVRSGPGFTEYRR